MRMIDQHSRERGVREDISRQHKSAIDARAIDIMRHSEVLWYTLDRTFTAKSKSIDFM